MPRALPTELRRRVVEAFENGEGSYKELAERFQVGEASVSRWLRRAREGRLEPTDRHGPRLSRRKLTGEHRAFLNELIEVMPDSTAPELVACLEERFGMRVSETTVKRERRRLGYTPKRGSELRSANSGPTS